MVRIIQLSVCVVILYLSVSSLSSTPLQNDNLMEIKLEIHQSLNSENLNQLYKTSERLQELMQTSGDKKLAYVYYYAGYIHYRLHIHFPGNHLNEKKNDLNVAIHYLKIAVDVDPHFAEAHALLAGCYGQKATGIFSTLKHGLKFKNSIDKAIEFEPNNPRVMLIAGIGELFKPSIVGGSPEAAIQKFKKSLYLFDNRQITNVWSPEWGHEEAYAWLGKVYMDLGKYQNAIESYKNALELKPDYPWVRKELLPRAEQLLKEKQS